MTDDLFIVEPYLQLGDAATQSSTDTLLVLWHAHDKDCDWSLQYKQLTDAAWREADSITYKRIALHTIPPHRVFSAEMVKLSLSLHFDYRILIGSQVVYTAQGKARPGALNPYRLVVMGDCGYGLLAKIPDARLIHGQSAISRCIHEAKPDAVIIPGDAVYNLG